MYVLQITKNTTEKAPRSERKPLSVNANSERKSVTLKA